MTVTPVRPDLSEPVPTEHVRALCSDCAKRPGPVRPRVLPDGKRCAEHIQQRKQRARLRQHFARVRRTYNLTEEQWMALYRAQGGRCAICGVARGIDRMLGVDHDHNCCNGPRSCGRCVRGLLCSGSLNANTCNRLIAHYDLAALRRAVAYLEDPPARRILGGAQ